MRFAFAPFAMLIATLASASGPPSDPCEAWNLLGFRIGMTRDEAVALHGGTFRKKTISRFPPNAKPYSRQYAELHPNIAPRRNAYRPDPNRYDPEMIVRFEATGGAIAIVMTPKSNSATTKLELVRTFGPPFADALMSDPEGSPFGTVNSTQTIWESEACGVDLYLYVIQSRSGGFEELDARLVLVRHGGHYESR